MQAQVNELRPQVASIGVGVNGLAQRFDQLMERGGGDEAGNNDLRKKQNKRWDQENFRRWYYLRGGEELLANMAIAGDAAGAKMRETVGMDVKVHWSQSLAVAWLNFSGIAVSLHLGTQQATDTAPAYKEITRFPEAKQAVYMMLQIVTALCKHRLAEVPAHSKPLITFFERIYQHYCTFESFFLGNDIARDMHKNEVAKVVGYTDGDIMQMIMVCATNAEQMRRSNNLLVAEADPATIIPIPDMQPVKTATGLRELGEVYNIVVRHAQERADAAAAVAASPKRGRELSPGGGGGGGGKVPRPSDLRPRRPAEPPVRLVGPNGEVPKGDECWADCGFKWNISGYEKGCKFGAACTRTHLT
jgi:hypothetical protein